jgi:RNA-directed DNA polymerase
MGLVPPPKVEKLQAALHTKAKEAPDYRFYALYDKLYRKDILQYAFYRCLANQGVAGVDGVTFEWIEGYGEERWLDELAEELRLRRGWSAG